MNKEQKLAIETVAELNEKLMLDYDGKWDDMPCFVLTLSVDWYGISLTIPYKFSSIEFNVLNSGDDIWDDDYQTLKEFLLAELKDISNAIQKAIII